MSHSALARVIFLSRLTVLGGAPSLFAFIAWMSRRLGYPICHNDELNWLGILKQLEAGVVWPVSGPGFIHTVQGVADQLSLGKFAALSWMGIAGVFISILLLCWGYRRISLSTSALTLVVLALSSYFWAPLLESRPQQWGQIMVFCGALCCWLWLHRRGGIAFFLILPLIALTHILSHAILLWLCAFLVLSDYFENRPLTIRHSAALVAMLASLAIYLIPDGPYAVMLRDVQYNHLRHVLVLAPELGAGVLAVGLAAVVVQRHWQRRPAWPQAVAHMILQRKMVTALSLLALIVTALAMQAMLLPDAAWRPYRGSVALFFVMQLGNLMFVACVIVGLHRFAQGLLDQSMDAVMGRFLLWVLVGLSALSVVAIVLSWWLLDTNWFLRVVNYGLLFAGIVAAMGLQPLLHSRWRPWVIFLILVGATISLIAVLRPPAILSC